MNNKKRIINSTLRYVRKKLAHDSSGHDWWHVYRVWKIAKKIANKEGDKLNVFVIELASLLHDIADYKLHSGNEDIGPTKARKWLEKMNVSVDEINHVCKIIKDISFRGAKVKSKAKTKEGMIVQDADRIDALGALGIARAFAYGGRMGKLIYDPSIKPVMHGSFEEYKNNKSSTINHFYEKLLLLEKLMNTEYAKRIARERTMFIKKFLEEFYSESDGSR